MPTVEGPEATDLIDHTQGFILLHTQETKKSRLTSLFQSSISAVKDLSFPAHVALVVLEEFAPTPRYVVRMITLPEFHETVFNSTVRLNGEEAHIDHLTGPDEEGRIVYTAEGGDFGRTSYLALTTTRWENHEIIFSRSKRLIDSTPLGKPLELAPKGGYVTFVRKDGRIPDEFYTLEIWNVLNKQKVDEFPVSWSTRVSWFSDGIRFAYEKYIHYSEVPNFASLPTDWGGLYATYGWWPQAPVTFIYNMSEKTHTLLHTGSSPKVAFGDAGIVLSDANFKNHLVDLVTKQPKQRIDWPVIDSIISFAGPNTLLCLGLPTAGTPARWTRVYSPFVRTRPMLSVKLVDLSTGEFQTVIPHIDPKWYRTKISYGRVKESFDV